MPRAADNERSRVAHCSWRDGGATFIELLVSIVLIGLTAVAVLAATTAAITGARTSDQIAKSQAAIAEVADYVTDTDPETVAYLDCGANSPAAIQAAYQLDIDSRFGVGTVVVDGVAFWNGSSFGGCAFTSGERLQEVSLRTVVNGSERSVVVVKRPIDVPTVSVQPPDTVPPYTGGSGQAVVTLTDWMVTWP